MRIRFHVAFAVFPALLLAGCFNLPTHPSQITGSYTSGLRYEGVDCSRLSSELNSLERREDQLVDAQEQRRQSGKLQAFWLGFGQGDGIEATELANVRGEKESVRKALDFKRCEMTSQASVQQAGDDEGADDATWASE